MMRPDKRSKESRRSTCGLELKVRRAQFVRLRNEDGTLIECAVVLTYDSRRREGTSG